MKKNVVIVESPTKSKTIEKYLGKDFAVVASFGHVRDLPSRPNSVEPACNFKMHYEVSPKAEKYIKEIAKVIKDADNVYLATDPDREGESISWHIVDELKLHNRISPHTNIYRITFNEITKKAVQHAIENPKRINMDLVYAQQARRALDYLVGFEISPILWRKLPGSRSAGRVQSVALRLVCERENEIEKFIKEEYWSIDGNFITEKKDGLIATLTVLHGKKLEKMSITMQKDADEAVDFLKVLQYSIGSVVRKETKRNPPVPFITSTLQQEASNNLGISPKTTMSIAQKLYEGINIDGNNVGLITYMRTDGIYIAQDVITDMRLFIKNCYGEQYLPKSPRMYKNKVKNAQEAHEAIRPTDAARTPESLKNYLDPMQLKLYTMIWGRTLASQMKEAIFDQTTINICSTNGLAEFRATGSVLIFDGFLRVYKGEDRDVILPDVSQGEGCELEKLTPKQHFTQPPPRYTEASIIKTLEDFGIGRPSTYASIISILQDRKYVAIEKKKITPEVRGRIVNAFLVLFFKKYVEYDFTANLEKLLDEVSNGKMSWLNLLEDFWRDFAPTVNEIGQQKKQFIIAEIEKAMEGVIFTKDNKDKDGSTADRAPESVCPKCGKGTMQLKFSKFGGFLGCSNYPECNFVQNIAAEGAKQESGGEYPKILGEHQGGMVSLRKGPYGLYIQHDMPGQKKPKRVSISPADTVDLRSATMLLSLPLLVGMIDGKEVYLDKKKFGFFIRHDEKNYSVKGIDPFSLSIADVQKIITKQKD